jgi:hypothetical protein
MSNVKNVIIAGAVLFASVSVGYAQTRSPEQIRKQNLTDCLQNAEMRVRAAIVKASQKQTARQRAAEGLSSLPPIANRQLAEMQERQQRQQWQRSEEMTDLSDTLRDECFHLYGADEEEAKNGQSAAPTQVETQRTPTSESASAGSAVVVPPPERRRFWISPQ